MIKVLGVLFLLLGFSGLSVEKVKDEKAGLRRLVEIKNLTMYLLREIQYSHIPIPDICVEYLGRGEGEIGNFLERVCKKYETNEGKSFDALWTEEINATDRGYKGKREEKELLIKLSKSFGYCNTGMQLSAIEQYLQEVEKMIAQKEKKFQDNKKLIIYFGVMSGLFLSIILL